jgi:hypothetical protein|tara:strand:- start:189 stop:1445 length:1257 start_codon:yes stop_codon:yes gene_type:complete
MTSLGKLIVGMTLIVIVLAGCQTTSGSSSGISIGPQLSSFINKVKRIGKEPISNSDPDRPRLDIVIPVFDPGLPEEGKEYDEEGLWPELRRAEAIRFAQKLKTALEATEAFGAVRITPDKTATGDLYILAKIEESDGEDVQIAIEVFDISGTLWLADSFDHEVQASFHKNVRNEGKDPYDPVFEEAAKSIVEELGYHETAELKDIQRLTDLRFGASFVEDAFSEHMALDDGNYKLVSFPSTDDPMLARTKAVRVRDQLFVDGLQDNYRSFSEKMDTSYAIWQEQSLLELKAKREANAKAVGEAVGGVLLIGLAVAAVVAGADSNSVNASMIAGTAGVVAGVAGAKLLSNSFQTSEEAKVHRDALEELGESIDSDLAPRVVAFEKQTVELTGSAKEQFAQWRAFLKRIHVLEKTPEKLL